LEAPGVLLQFPLPLPAAARLGQAQVGEFQLAQARPVVTDPGAQTSLEEQLIRALWRCSTPLVAPAFPGLERLAGAPVVIEVGGTAR